jgi:hypothetical protein
MANKSKELAVSDRKDRSIRLWGGKDKILASHRLSVSPAKLWLPCALFFVCDSFALSGRSMQLGWLTCCDTAERGQLALEQGHVLVLNATTLATEVRRVLTFLPTTVTKNQHAPIILSRLDESACMTYCRLYA